MSLLNWLFFYNLEGIYLYVLDKFLAIMLLITEIILWG